MNGTAGTVGDVTAYAILFATVAEWIPVYAAAVTGLWLTFQCITWIVNKKWKKTDE